MTERISSTGILKHQTIQTIQDSVSKSVILWVEQSGLNPYSFYTYYSIMHEYRLFPEIGFHTFWMYLSLCLSALENESKKPKCYNECNDK
jgi:hypothetical protein